MAPSVPKKKRKVNLPENEEVAARIFDKSRSIASQQPGGLPEHQARALSAAYSGVCTAKEPVRTAGDLARLKGVGGWVVDVMKDCFPGSSLDLSPPRSNTPGETGKKRKRNKPYVPQLNSAAYAIVITLYREMIRGTEVMKKQELIDAAEASGLSRKAIGPNNYKSKHGNSGSDFYTGWSCMKNLTEKDLVVKKSNPAKYYLTEKGKETARICLAKSGLDDPAGPFMATGHPESVMLSDSDSDEQEGSSPLIGSENFSERSGLPNSKAGNSSSFPTNNGRATNSPLSSQGMFGQQSFSAMGSAENSLLAMPPRQCDESFLDTYEVVLILDDRDTFGARARRKVVDNIHTQFDVPVKIKHLPVGDALWIARHKQLGTEYVLDFIVERKNVDDLLGSIKDNRYKDQKLRLKKCGLRKLIYLVEGDVNTVDGSESVKTACFTTEVLEGFDVQRTNGYADTEKKYGHLTRSIIDYYRTNFSAGADTSRLCLTYDEFVKRCSDLEKVTVSDIFALQLMQVPQVTEEAALAVTSLYPTLLSLAKAYAMLDGDRRAQEEMLKNKSDMVNAGASKNIFKLIWAE
uniref:Crossover junction endonuclease MUS81 n=3 Tax=Aegilops tauschii subsp. strangulata TaxID=200361 RepID=A0A453GM41_AEGTS